MMWAVRARVRGRPPTELGLPELPCRRLLSSRRGDQLGLRAQVARGLHPQGSFGTGGPRQRLLGPCSSQHRLPHRPPVTQLGKEVLLFAPRPVSPPTSREKSECWVPAGCTFPARAGLRFLLEEQGSSGWSTGRCGFFLTAPTERQEGCTQAGQRCQEVCLGNGHLARVWRWALLRHQNHGGLTNL